MRISPGLLAQPATGISGGHAQLQVLYLVSWPAPPGNLGRSMRICPGPPARPVSGIGDNHPQLQVLCLVTWPAAPGNPAPLDAEWSRAAGDGDHRWLCLIASYYK